MVRCGVFGEWLEERRWKQDMLEPAGGFTGMNSLLLTADYGLDWGDWGWGGQEGDAGLCLCRTHWRIRA